MTIIASPHFYVYVLCRPNGKPFYVGKGSGKRVHKHEMEARSGHRCYKCNVIRKIWREGGEVQRYIVFTTNDEQEAFAFEIEYIRLHGLENLTNHTTGGQGPSGRVFTEKQREAMSVQSKKQWTNPEYRARQIETFKLRWSDPEERARHSARMIRIRRTVSQTMADSWTNPEIRAKRVAVMKIANARPERRQQASEQTKAIMSTPERRLQLQAQTTANWKDPEIRAKRTAALRAQAATPESRARQRAGTLAYYARKRAAKEEQAKTESHDEVEA